MKALHEMVRGPNAMKNSFEDMLYEYIEIAEGNNVANDLWYRGTIKRVAKDGKLTAEEVFDEDDLYLDGERWFQMGGVRGYAMSDEFCPAIPGYEIYTWSESDIKRDCTYLTKDTITKKEFIQSMRRFCKTPEYKERAKDRAEVMGYVKRIRELEKRLGIKESEGMTASGRIPTMEEIEKMLEVLEKKRKAIKLKELGVE